ncbi:hypothetical protein OUZ56_011896 [Daphnia magna]|uniref:GMP synthase n=1 Tax=Daphnia magna TaxID=35525 RepID=A0ABQ9Z1P6_9CRUS|nr:hypothetical protein OUZ56_011896 [Daphnia magna]
MKLPSGEIIALFGSTMPTVASPVPLRRIHLTTSMETRIGQDYEPTASRTRIGWIVRGAIGELAKSIAMRIHMIFATDYDVDLLAQQFKRFCDTEDFGTEHRQPGLSEVDKQATQILKNGVRKLKVGYEAPIT